MFTARDVLDKVSLLLQDTGAFSSVRRHPLPELCGWLNEALGAIVLQKPSATSRHVNLNLTKGTLQRVPDGYIAFLKPVVNVRGEDSDRMPRRTISMVSQEQITNLNPTWHDEYSVPYAQQVKHCIFDEIDPHSFYVYPGNDGTGIIQAVLSAEPTKIKAMEGLDEHTSEAYAVEIPFEDIYEAVIIDYVIYRARSKDTQDAGNATRAALHYQQFANALGIKISAEQNTSPNRKSGVPYSAAGVA